MVFALLMLLLAGGVVAWVVLAGRKTQLESSVDLCFDPLQRLGKRTTHASASLTYVGLLNSRGRLAALSKNQCSPLGLTAKSGPPEICSHPDYLNCLEQLVGEVKQRSLSFCRPSFAW